MRRSQDIIFLCHRMPYPPNKGDKIRAHAILTRLAQTRRVHLGCFVDDPGDMAHAATLRAMLGGECLFVPLHKKMALLRGAAGMALGRSVTEGYFHHRAIAGWIESVLRRHPISQAVVYGSAMAPYLMGHRRIDVRRCLLDLVDVDSDKWTQYAEVSPASRRWLYACEAARVAGLERQAAAAFGRTVLVSPHEVATFAALAPESAHRLHSVSNGVDLEYFNADLSFERPFPKDHEAIVMTGVMDYWPNRQGAEWFAAEVMPLLREKMPRACFYVVGTNPPARFLAQSGAGVVVTGRVPDVRPYLAHAAVAVAPLKVARGLQNKVLEAMAMHRAVVATTAATRALAAVPGREFLLADTAQDFAQAVSEAAGYPSRLKLGAQARRYVEKSHQWSRSLEEFDELLDALRWPGQRQVVPKMGIVAVPDVALRAS